MYERACLPTPSPLRWVKMCDFNLQFSCYEWMKASLILCSVKCSYLLPVFLLDVVIFLMICRCFLFIGEISSLSVIWMPKTASDGLSLLLFVYYSSQICRFSPREGIILPTLLTSGSCVTCFGQLNVGRSRFVTLGWSLNCQRFAHSVSCCHGNWHQQMMAVPPAEEPKVKVAAVTTWEQRPQPVCERTYSTGKKESFVVWCSQVFGFFLAAA